MQYCQLGSTGLTVSRLCLGTLTMGPLQQNFSISQASPVLEEALLCGVDFLDTAQLYETYPLVREALRLKPDLVVSTKCYAYDTATAEESYRMAVEGIGRDFIDIFMLHEQESEHTLRGHWEAVEYFAKRQREGAIGAIGISTHHIAAVWAAIKRPEIAIIHPIFNMNGLGIIDGSREEMEMALQAAHEAGKGIFAMKALGGGHLLREREAAFAYVLEKPYVHAVAVGMQSVAEVRWNAARFADNSAEADVEIAARESACRPRRLMIHDYCGGCGACVRRCGFGALRLENGKAVVDQNACTFCGYCAAQCKDFCIKVV